jgi:hypothetical protein
MTKFSVYDVGVPFMSQASVAAPPAPTSHRAAILTGAILLIVSLAAAVSVDVVRAGYKVKGDEATYVAMALSAAYDRDLTYERRDLERFWGIYQQGPEGIFLKRGKQFRVRLRAAPPFLSIFNNSPDARNDRLYFGKAMIYSVVVAPFVWLLGMNGFLVFHVLCLFVAGTCGYLFLAARSRSGPALGFTLAFLGASVVPVYAVFLTSDLFNFWLVFLAYFLWLYKEVAAPRMSFLKGVTSDLTAAILLGVVTYSKPWHAPLVLPLVLLFWWRRAWLKGVVTGGLAVAACAGLFLVNALVTGEFNYQGGDRKAFYSAPPPAPPTAGFPFDAPDGTWERRGGVIGRDDVSVDNVLQPSEIGRLFANNVKYFLLGRHFGFVPYFFPGALAIILWLSSRERFQPWRVFAFIGVVTATLAVLVLVPYTWSGGGGPPGNRYFLSFYPALFFITPPLQSALPALVAWLGGALFTAKILVSPFYYAKFTWEITDRGFARRLPVELTMANDLPVRLDTRLRARIPYGDPRLLLYFLDEHAFPPEPEGMWISGSGRAEIIVRTVNPVGHFRITAGSPIRSTFTVSAGAGSRTVQIEAGGPRLVFDVPVGAGVRGLNGYAYLLKAWSTDGFTPRLRDPNSTDDRNLGVQMHLQAVSASP